METISEIKPEVDAPVIYEQRRAKNIFFADDSLCNLQNCPKRFTFLFSISDSIGKLPINPSALIVLYLCLSLVYVLYTIDELILIDVSHY